MLVKTIVEIDSEMDSLASSSRKNMQEDGDEEDIIDDDGTKRLFRERLLDSYSCIGSLDTTNAKSATIERATICYN